MTTAAPPLDAARILVVDDELGPRESLRMLLKPSYQIQTADSGRTALDQIPAYRPDIVILDIKMPELDGLEVLRRIKRIDPAIEVVMITAYASLETVKMALTEPVFPSVTVASSIETVGVVPPGPGVRCTICATDGTPLPLTTNSV